MSSKFIPILLHDLKITFKKKGNITNLLAFFAIISSLFPLSIGYDSNILRSIGTGVVWVAALFVSTLSLTKIFEEDYENGTLEQIILEPVMPQTLVLAKALAHWISSGLAITLFSPLIVLMFGVDINIAIPLIISLLLGTPVLSLIGIMGAGLTLGIKRGGVIASLLVTPLYIPSLIFGTGMVESASFGFSSEQFISNAAGLFCIFLIMLPLSVWSSAKSLRIALEE